MAKALAMLGASRVDFSKVISASYPFTQVGEAVLYVERQLGLKSMVLFSKDKEAH
jgi:hypothetical protein